MTAIPESRFPAERALPLVGDAHPLRQAYARSFARALAAATCVHLAVFAGVEMAGRFREPVADSVVRLIEVVRLPTPPPIVLRDSPPALQDVVPISPPAVGIPEPVQDWLAGDQAYGDIDDLRGILDDPFEIGGAGDGENVALRIPQAEPGGDPLPDEFVATEEDPVLISLPAPIYPEMARQAEVEGTVVIRALVGKDGQVKSAIVTASIPMLDEAALAAVRLAVFKPALQQQRPVAVWVQIPMRFRLQ